MNTQLKVLRACIKSIEKQDGVSLWTTCVPVKSGMGIPNTLCILENETGFYCDAWGFETVMGLTLDQVCGEIVRVGKRIDWIKEVSE